MNTCFTITDQKNPENNIIKYIEKYKKNPIYMEEYKNNLSHEIRSRWNIESYIKFEMYDIKILYTDQKNSENNIIKYIEKYKKNPIYMEEYKNNLNHEEVHKLVLVFQMRALPISFEEASKFPYENLKVIQFPKTESCSSKEVNPTFSNTNRSKPFFTETEAEIIRLIKSTTYKSRFLIAQAHSPIIKEIAYFEKIISSNSTLKIVFVVNDLILPINTTVLSGLKRINEHENVISIFPKSLNLYDIYNKGKGVDNFSVNSVNSINVICRLWGLLDRNKATVIKCFYHLSHEIRSRWNIRPYIKFEMYDIKILCTEYS
jgi:hypothetical protein